MEQQTAHRARPTLVTIAVALWWAGVVVGLVVAAPGIIESVRRAGGAIIGASVGLVVILAWSATLVWLASRMGRGSRTARLWLAIIAGLGACNSGTGVSTVGLDWRLLAIVCVVVAAVLSYLPSARSFFPREERHPGTAELHTIGWDPTTGERIVEMPPTRDRAH